MRADAAPPLRPASMIVYQHDKAGFCRDVETGDIDGILLDRVRGALGVGVGTSEVRSWHQSLTHMHLVLGDPGIPDDAGVGIEFQIPQTAEATAMDGVVRTVLGGGLRDTAHPSYQAWSYAELLRGFNETVYEDDVALHPCAFLHNYRAGGALHSDVYRTWLEQAPLFAKEEVQRLRDFIKKWIRYGDGNEIILRIDGGRIRPSKALADSLASLMQGNREFTMIDEQKVVYERALDLARTTPAGDKRVLIVHGGPGTGKSVVAVNLLVRLTQDRELVQYVMGPPHHGYGEHREWRCARSCKARGGVIAALLRRRATPQGGMQRRSNAIVPVVGWTSERRAPGRLREQAHRHAVEDAVLQSLSRIRAVHHRRPWHLPGPGRRRGASAEREVGALQEPRGQPGQGAHPRGRRDRLLPRRGSAGHARRHRHPRRDRAVGREVRGRSRGAGTAVAVPLQRLGRIPRLGRSRPRHPGDGPRRSLDPGLRLRLPGFRLSERGPTPHRGAQRRDRRARMVAGYCWRWKSKKDPEAWDVVLPEHDFRMRWNLTQHGSGWLAHPESINEIGCIHTCQGLDLDYVGVVIGPDLVVRDSGLVTVPEERDRYDSSIRGYKKRLKADPEQAKADARRIILNTYRTLMTRGMKGCYVYAVDEGVREWLRGGAGGEDG